LTVNAMDKKKHSQAQNRGVGLRKMIICDSKTDARVRKNVCGRLARK